MATDNHEAKTSFNVDDPDLPLIAAYAASEIERIMKNRDGGLENVATLAELLRNSTERDHLRAEQKSLMDPLSLDAFQRAYFATYDQRLGSSRELAEISAELADKLANITGKLENSVLGAFRDFCLALSKYALSSTTTIDDLTSVRSPFKR